MLKSFKENFKAFLKDERGDSVTWIVLIIIGVVIAIAAYVKFKGAPGNVGNQIQSAGDKAANGLGQVDWQ